MRSGGVGRQPSGIRRCAAKFLCAVLDRRGSSFRTRQMKNVRDGSRPIRRFFAKPFVPEDLVAAVLN
jgi:hypothetical protein